MPNRLFRNLPRGERGITGLEPAIILIAFVVVASVFAYTVLSAGIFSSEKGKEAVYSGLETARSSMSLQGSVVARDTNSNDEVNDIIFTVSNTLEGESVALTITIDAAADGVLVDEDSPTHSMVIPY